MTGVSSGTRNTADTSMNIAMFTNLYTPHVGGVARSVEQLVTACREAGHRVCVVAPEFRDAPAEERDVIRIPAVQRFNGSDFSVGLPVYTHLHEKLDRFQPDVLHSHHPFLLGDTALRVAERRQLPLVFTHHTMYEQYTHYVPADCPALRRFVVALCTGYANMCDHVIAPSRSLAAVLDDRGVRTPISVIPSGVDCDRFNDGDGLRARGSCGVPEDAFVVGHVGRLAPEKNLAFLVRAVGAFLARSSTAHFLVVGDGPEREAMERLLGDLTVAGRAHFVGVQTGQTLIDLYHAMDLFVFASKTETQGMVLAEAMAAGVPVVALDADGVRDAVTDGETGVLLAEENVTGFADAVRRIACLSRQERSQFQENARHRAREFSTAVRTTRTLALYREVMATTVPTPRAGRDSWDELCCAIQAEWDVWSNRLSAAMDMLENDEGRLE